ncbi:MAG: nickel ABC transporter permease subunit NikC, partial [Deltaproteobacteria bacterium]|nr:nickel ABC transporter permease subunit NikC [Deltaproteobacteria bacterium]
MRGAKLRFVVFGILALAIAAAALLAPVLAARDPHQAVLTEAVRPPSAEHYFGTDRMGRDLFSRVIYGTRTSLAATLALVVCIFTVGSVMGIVSGYAGGLV